LEAKKYKTRDYPPYSATACKGAKLIGNDGQKYISKAFMKGIYKWVKIAEKRQIDLCNRFTPGIIKNTACRRY